MGNEVGLMIYNDDHTDMRTERFPSPMGNEVGLIADNKYDNYDNNGFRPLWGMR